MNKMYQKPFPGNKNAGFTLIELLVVVLIIGILAAVALPQYRIAVAKAKMMRLAPLTRSIYEAVQRCAMTGEMTNDGCLNFANLDISIPDATIEESNIGTVAKFKNAHCEIYDWRVSCHPAEGAWWKNAGYTVASEGAYCLVSNDGAFDDTQWQHKVCKSLGGIKASSGWNDSDQTSTYTFYRLP